MEEKELQTTEKAVKAKKKIEPKKKKITIAAVIVGIIAVVAILIGINQTAIMSDINYAFMPKSITPTVDGVQVEFLFIKIRISINSRIKIHRLKLLATII